MQNSLIKTERQFLGSIFILLVSLCSAQWSMAASENEIIENLAAARPDLRFEFVGESVLPGFYEVQIEDGSLLYVSADGGYFFEGNIYQITGSDFVDIRELALKESRRQLFASRGTDDMIVFKAVGPTKAIINVFTDVDCGYCRKLHNEVPELNAMGIEIRYLAFPRAGLESESYDKMATAWCSNTPNETLTAIKNGTRTGTSVCDDNPVAEHYRLGNSLGVTGTPATILMDGTLILGYRSAVEFAELLGLTTSN